MQVNNYEIIDRSNRPNISQRIGLRTFFINDGAYVDPYEISSVQLFTCASTLSPNTVLGADNLVSATPLMEFAASNTAITIGDADSSSFDPSNYNPASTASGIYRIGQGDYVVILDGTVNLSGWNAEGSVELGASSLSSVNDYVDIWTVKLNAASKYQTITNQFSLYEDTFFAFTEPLLLNTSHKLLTKNVRLGEVVDLKITTDVGIQNKNLPKNVEDIFKDSVVTSALVEIKKVNSDHVYDGPFTVSSFSDSDGLVTVTGDDTMILSWNTEGIKTLSAFTEGDFGSLTGTYSVQAKYNLLNETIISPLFYLTVT